MSHLTVGVSRLRETQNEAGLLWGRSANTIAKPTVARLYRARPIHIGLMTDRPDVRLTATQTLGTRITAAPINMSRDI